MPPRPFFSIIIPCKNPGRCLQYALGSIVAQADANFETIVVDGGSTDGTLNFLNVHAAEIDTIISERDRGVYDAMNKGVLAARGDWILFLGADDRFESESVLKMAHEALQSTEAKIACGNVIYADGRRWNFSPHRNIKFRNFLHHQGCFYRREVLLNIPYDFEMKYQGDYDLNVRIWKAGHAVLGLPFLIAICGAGGLSDSGKWENYREEIALRHNHFGRAESVIYDVGTFGRFIWKTLRRAQAKVRPEKRPSPSRNP
jgi:putative colanic acid biosynthesis glycosyltransferase